MTKNEIHNIFKDFIVTVRGEKAIIFIGYKGGHEGDGFLVYDENRMEEAVAICENIGVKYRVTTKTEYGHQAIRIYIAL